MSELNKFTRLFKNVKRCKELNWQEKAILTEIISFQLDGNPFNKKDITLALDLAMDKGTVSKFINRLFKKGVLDKSTISFPSSSGGKYKRLRTVTVKNIDSWTTVNGVPVVLEIPSEGKAKVTPAVETAKESSTSTKEVKVAESVTPPVTKLKSTKNDLPIGFKKPLERRNGETDEGYQSRVSYYIKKAGVITDENPNIKDFSEFAVEVLQNEALDEKYLKIVWNKMDLSEQVKITKKLHEKIEQFLN